LNGSGASGVYGTLGVPSASNVPGSRWEAVTWTDSTGNLWLLGGTGLDSAGTQGDLNDLWKYSGGEWTWMGGSNLVNQQGSYGTLGVTAEGDFPGARHGALGWVDSSGNFWLFGGIGLDVAGTMQGMFNDLWKYSSGEWTWVSGSDLKDQAAVYGTMGAAAPTNVPGARCSLSGWVDSSGGLWLFGGDTFSGMLNDLWKFSNGEWTWVSGANTAGQGGIYGVRGTPGAGNLPGARQLAVSWTDRAGNFWLFGGNGPDSAANEGLLNDLWKYSNGQWTWVSGSNIVDQSGAYGTQGILAPANIPGARIEAESFIDASGNLWLFGGYGVVPNSDTNFNDLWMYMP
jgi:hypothetical protein